MTHIASVGFLQDGNFDLVEIYSPVAIDNVKNTPSYYKLIKSKNGIMYVKVHFFMNTDEEVYMELPQKFKAEKIKL